jgi:hypothetical protein
MWCASLDAFCAAAARSVRVYVKERTEMDWICVTKSGHCRSGCPVILSSLVMTAEVVKPLPITVCWGGCEVDVVVRQAV